MAKATTKTGTNGAAKTTTKKNRISGALPASDAPSTSKICVPQVVYNWAEIELVGTTPLLVNKFRKAALDEMEDKQMGRAVAKKPPRVPDQEFREAAHICEGGYSVAQFPKSLHGFPAIAIKKAMANAAYRFGGAKNIVETISVIFINGPYNGLVPIYQALPTTVGAKTRGAIPEMRRDMVVLQGGKPVASIAYRPEYYPWSMKLQVRYWEPIINLESVVNALSMAGQFVGIGSWRVETKGDRGMFRIGAIRELPSDYVPEAKHG